MTQPRSGVEAVAPLLIELARAVRAYQFFEAGHATRAHALQKAVGVWAAGLVHTGPLELEVSETGFTLAGVDAVEGPALDDLARTLHFHHVMGLEVHPSVRPDELGAFVEAVSQEPQTLAPRGGLRAVLAAEGVRHLALWEIPGVVSADAQANPASQPMARPDPLPEERPDALEQPENASEITVELLKELAQLEQCEELGDYRLAANRVDGALSRLLAAKNWVDAYRAALVLCRHIADTHGRSPQVRHEAQGRLGDLFRSEDMMKFVIERAYEPHGITSVQAVQVLTSLAPQSVTRLLAHHSRGDGDVRNQTSAILIAMGEQAFPVIVDELQAESPGRARRAARLLGDMQNPSGVEFLADSLHSSDAAMQREVAQSLARIGTNRAVRALTEALDADPELAVIAASALGNCRTRAATRALLDVLPEKSGKHETLKREAIRALGRIADPDTLTPLLEILDRKGFMSRKKARPMRIAAAQAIARIGGEQAFMALSTHASSGDPQVQRVCEELVRQVERSG